MAVDAVSRESSRSVRSSQRAEQAEARKAERARRQEARRADRERQAQPVQQPAQQPPVQQQPPQTEAPKPEAEESRSKNFIGDLKGARVVNFAVQGGRNSNSISVFASGQGPNARPDTPEKKAEETKPDSSAVDVEA